MSTPSRSVTRFAKSIGGSSGRGSECDVGVNCYGAAPRKSTHPGTHGDVIQQDACRLDGRKATFRTSGVLNVAFLTRREGRWSGAAGFGLLLRVPVGRGLDGGAVALVQLGPLAHREVRGPLQPGRAALEPRLDVVREQLVAVQR